MFTMSRNLRPAFGFLKNESTRGSASRTPGPALRRAGCCATPQAACRLPHATLHISPVVVRPFGRASPRDGPLHRRFTPTLSEGALHLLPLALDLIPVHSNLLNCGELALELPDSSSVRAMTYRGSTF